MRAADLAVALLASMAATAQAQPVYSVVDLGRLGGGFDTSALAVNNAGHVVGAAMDNNGHYAAFLYANSPQGLGSLGGGTGKANAINPGDQIVGNSKTATGETHAFLYNAGDANPTMSDLHGLIGFGGVFSSATSIDRAGRIVGAADLAGGSLHAFVLTGNTAVDLHSSVAFGGPNSFAYAISDTGWIAGIADDASGHSLAFLYDLNTSTVTNLGTLGGPNSVAMAVNKSGSVAGNARTSANSDTAYAFLAQQRAPIDASNSLGALGGAYSFAHGMNAFGQVAGEAEDADTLAHAFLYDPSAGMQDLESLIPANSGWIFSSATAISNSGYIVGSGTHNGRSSAFLLKPLAMGTVSVTRAGSGSGVVSSADGEIDCGPRCASAYQSGRSVTLTATADAGSIFTGWLGACTGTAACNLDVQSSAGVSATFAPDTVLPRVDIDGNAGYDALTDGLLMIRYLFGLTDTSLTNGAVAPGATRSSPADILLQMDNIRPLLDVDGNGQVDALTDGLLLIRYLFGLRGPTLIAGAVGPGATRSTAPAIEAYVSALMP